MFPGTRRVSSAKMPKFSTYHHDHIFIYAAFSANKCNKHDTKRLSQRDECITMGLYAIAWRQKLDCLLAQCNQSEDPNPRNCTEMQIEQCFKLPN